MMNGRQEKSIWKLCVASVFLTVLIIASSLQLHVLHAAAATATVVNGEAQDPNDPKTVYGFKTVKQEGADWYGLKYNTDSTTGAFTSFDIWKSTDGGSTYAFDNTILSTADGVPSDSRFEAIKWFKSPVTGMWNLWMKRQSTSGPLRELAHVQSTAINGNYDHYTSSQPYGHPSGDLGVFTDSPTPVTYLVSSDTVNHIIYIYQLNDDCTEIVGEVNSGLQWADPATADGLDHREAPSIRKQGSYYYLFTSGQTGWFPNQMKYAYTTSLSNEVSDWSPQLTIGDSTGYHSQLFSTGIASESFPKSLIFTGTRNAQVWGGTSADSRKVWLPIYFNSDTDLTTNYYDYVTIDDTTGDVIGYDYDIGHKLAIAGATAPTGTAGNSYDGNMTTKWMNDNQLGTATIIYDLGSSQNVKAVKLMLDVANNKRSHSLRIDVSDDPGFTSYTTAYEDHTPIIKWLQTLHFDAPATGRYIRLINTAANSQGNNNFGIFEFQAWGGDSNTVPLADERFDGQTTGSQPDGWTLSTPADTAVEVLEVPSAADKSMRISDQSSVNGAWAVKPFAPQSGSSVTVQLNFKFNQIGKDDYIRLKAGQTVAIDIVNSSVLNALAMRDPDGNDIKLFDFTGGWWYTLRLEINTDAGTYDVFVNNNLVYGGASFKNKVMYLDKLGVGTTASSVDNIFFDDITITGPND
ncbi:discoidin domain-containing protein [Paenibacillus sp. HB172176]|uniref:discoidin domain-containing protein n=1 Tax=Paenibacillus sp. HB172176 TaxID=2493690 RepID=UPI00143B2D44|nr:discoidin domain-containing protein [Paenibacillus sp. HB172176]